MRKTYPTHQTKGLFRCSGILDRSGPHLANQDCRGNISLSLSCGEKVSAPGGLAPFPPQNPVSSATRPPVHPTSAATLDFGYRVISQRQRCPRRLTQGNKIPTSYIHNHCKIECWASDLLFSVNLADIPLASAVLDVQSIFYVRLSTTDHKNILTATVVVATRPRCKLPFCLI